MLATRNKTKKIRKPVDWPNESIHGLLLLAGASILAEPSESCRCHRIGPSATGSGRKGGRGGALPDSTILTAGVMPMTPNLATPDACDSRFAREREGKGRILPNERREKMGHTSSTLVPHCHG